MDLPNILNTKGPVVKAEQQQLQQQLADAAASNNRNPSDTGSERAVSPHMSDHSSKFSSRSDHALHLSTMSSAPHYSESPQIMQQFAMVPNPYPTPTTTYENEYNPLATDDARAQQTPASATSEGTPVKAFSCSTCGKGFARRSDLARHERIHTGVRPHVCEWPGCKKQFIQRSALTVHARVHTGEKPHMCEHCTKPFSDSSSLARHRRIHSGKRPYKCPYADCQKTFTRRTTLTRHQSHHTGTVEEAAAATAAALASRPPPSVPRARSDGDAYSDTASNQSGSPPSHRNTSASPAGDIPPISLLPRQSGDYGFMGGRSLPPHMRNDFQPHSPRSSPTSTSPSTSSSFGGSHSRPSLTSHPAMFGPPPTLEPPTHHEPRSNGSAGGSPHLSTMGWQSPTQMGSPGPSESFGYPDSHYGNNHWSYHNSAVRRPQSTEPDQYETKPRLMSGEVWSGQM